MSRILRILCLMLALSLYARGQTIITGGPGNPPPPQFAAAPPPPCVDGQPGCPIPEQGNHLLLALGLLLGVSILSKDSIKSNYTS